MLPRRNRLRGSTQLARLRASGRIWRHPLAVLLVNENGLDNSRFAFIVSRRVGNAVIRNRAKRRIRECVRRHIDEINGGRDCLVIARPGIVQASAAELETAVMDLLSRASLLWVETGARPSEGKL